MTDPLTPADRDSREPPYPADTRAKGWRFELDYEKIDQSDTWGLAADLPLAKPCLLMMWLVAWTQEPCGSLPNDEAVIRVRCQIPPSVWTKLRDVLMRGWWLAADGRLYHPLLTKQVLEMLDNRAHGWRKHRDEVMRRHGYRCKYCGCTGALTLDHVMPRSRGGSDDPTNLVPACRPCNSAKGARTPEEWGVH